MAVAIAGISSASVVTCIANQEHSVKWNQENAAQPLLAIKEEFGET